jgi:3-isopropylmalate/(R)-2-methylmalate dehydratase small subunit
MTPFTTCSGAAAPLLRDNIDTDLIIRIERISQLRRGQFAPWAFETLRYRGAGPASGERDDCVLNRAPFRRATLLLAGANFGCGSSREMAVWALEEYGIRCVIAPSFGDIFRNNCLQNGLLPIVLPPATIAMLAAVAGDGTALEVDLRALEVRAPGLPAVPFEFDPAERSALLSGLDEIDQSLLRRAAIEAFEQRDRHARDWAYDLGSAAAPGSCVSSMPPVPR